VDSDSRLLLYRSSSASTSTNNANTEAAVGPGSWGSAQWWLVWLGMTLRARGVLQAEPFKFLNLGLLTYIGGSEAVAQVMVLISYWRNAMRESQTSSRQLVVMLSCCGDLCTSSNR